MKRGSASKHELEVTLAVAREQLLEAHTTQALELIEHARGQVAPWRAFTIYCRLNEVAGHEAQVLGNRVLARLGAKAGQRGGEVSMRVDVPSTVDEWESPLSWLGRVRRRLAGRKNHELRRWVELHTARTQVELLRVHVRGALSLIDLLKPEQSLAHAVEIYTDSMRVPPSLSRAIYFLALDQLSGAERGAGPGAPSRCLAGDGGRLLQVVTK